MMPKNLPKDIRQILENTENKKMPKADAFGIVYSSVKTVSTTFDEDNGE